MKPRILYWLVNKEHRRIYLPIVEDPRVEQRLVAYNSIDTSEIKLNVAKYTHISQLSDVIAKYKPDIFIQCDTSFDIPILKSLNIKRGYINHGIWPHSPNNINRLKDPFWKQFSLLCGASNMFKDLFEKYSDIKTPIAINTLTQFDCLYNVIKNKDEVRKQILFSSNNPSADKIITLFGHFCKPRVSLNPYNASYYKAAIELAKLAEQNNWLLVIKPKTTKVDSFLKIVNEPWVKQIEKLYLLLKQNKYVKFIHPHEDPYKYFCADVVVSSARSTIEVEAAMINNPIITMRVSDREIDPVAHEYENGTIDFNSAYVATTIDELLDKVKYAIFNDNTDLFNNQNKFIDHLGIIFDGNAHVRVIDNILKVL